MVQIAEEFIEAVQGRQILVQITEMVFAELASGVALRLKCSGKGCRLIRHTHIRACLPHRRKTSAQGNLTSDETRPARGATCLRIVVREQHALRSQRI